MRFLTASADKYTIGAAYLLGERTFRLLADLVSWVLLARYMGPHGLGLISFAQGLMALFVPLVHLGIDNFVVIDLVKREKRTQSALATAIALKLLSGVAAFALLAAIAVMTIEDSLGLTITLVLGGVLLMQFSNVFELYFNATANNREAALARLSAAVFSLVSKLLIVFLALPWIWVAASLLADWVFLATALATRYYRQAEHGKYSFSPSSAKSLLRRSWPLLLSGVTIIIYMKSDLVMLKYMAGNAEVGIYSAAARVSESIYFIPMVVASVFFPKILRAREKSLESYNSKLADLLSFLGTSSILIAISISILAGLIIGWLYGPAFVDSVAVLQIHVWAGLSVFVGVVRSKWLANEGLQMYDLAMNVGGAVVNVGLNFALIPSYGAVGAATATILSYSSATLFLPWLVRDLRGITRMIWKSYVSLPNLIKRARQA